MKLKMSLALMLTFTGMQARADGPWSVFYDNWRNGFAGASHASASASASSTGGSASASSYASAGGGSASASGYASATGSGASAHTSASASSGGASAWGSAAAIGSGWASASSSASVSSGSASASSSAHASGGGWASSGSSASIGNGYHPAPNSPCDVNWCGQSQQCVANLWSWTYSCVDKNPKPSDKDGHASATTCVNGVCTSWGQGQVPAQPAPQCNSSKGRRFEWYSGYYLANGGDLVGYPQYQSMDSCQVACADRKDCAGLTYLNTSGLCYLKGYNANRTPYPGAGWEALVKVPDGFQIVDNAYLAAGNDVKSLRTVNAEACESACDCEASCQAFTYHEPTQSCFLKNAAVNRQPYPSDNWVSGFR